MNNTARRLAMLGFAALLLGSVAALTGCSSPEPKLTKQEEANFKGEAPMPPEAQKRLADQMAAAAARRQQAQQGQPSGPQQGPK